MELIFMDNLSLNEAKDKIIEAIANQRWFFFENDTRILLDKSTGILWANLNNFPYSMNKNHYSGYYSENIAKSFLRTYKTNKFRYWSIPFIADFKTMISDKTFPFQEGQNWRIKSKWAWLCAGNYRIDLDHLSTEKFSSSGSPGRLLPCNYSLNTLSYLAKNEKPKTALDLFVENDLIPIFTDKRITALYKKIYIEKSFVPSKVVKQSVQITTPIKFNKIIKQPVQIETPIIFDSETLLSKYTSKNVDKSIIKYYQTIQQWINELMNNVDAIEKQKKDILSSFNTVGLKLSKKFINDPNLTTKENNLLKKRQ